MNHEKQTFDEHRQLCIHTALCFAKGIVWTDHQWQDNRTMKAMRDLDVFFTNSKDPDKALYTFCERALFASIYSSVMGSKDKDLWACLLHPRGIASNPAFETTPQSVNALKRKNPHIMAALPALVKHCLEYLREPSPTIVGELIEELTKVGCEGMVELFYQIVNSEQ